MDNKKKILSLIVQSIFTFSFFSWGTVARAETVVSLFLNGAQVGNYNVLIGNLKRGYILTFEDQTRYRFIGYLGSGNTTQIIEVEILDRVSPDKSVAMRLPKKSGIFVNDRYRTPYFEFINSFIKSKSALEKAELIPKSHGELAGQYILVDKLEIKFGLKDFLVGRIALGAEQRSAIEEALFVFSRKLAAFERIGDFSVNQIVFDGKRWVLLDFTGVVLLEGSVYPVVFEADHPFEQMPKPFLEDFAVGAKQYATAIINRISQEIFHERLKMAVDGKNIITGSILKVIPDRVGGERLIYALMESMRASQPHRRCGQTLSSSESLN